ncbi:MAG TPA: ATPase, T2SS/T4P/T4SS family, partial [Polyangia bacterium]
MSRLGELLVRENLISLSQLQKAQDEQRKTGARLGYSLTKLGILDETELTNFLSKQYGVPSINLADFEISPDVLQLVPAELAKRHQLLPVNRAGATLIVAMSDPSNIYAIDDLKFRTGLNIEVVVASEVAIDESIQRYYEKQVTYDDVLGDIDADAVEVGGDDDDVNIVDLEKASGEAPVIKLCNVILLNAIKKRASDIHIEPYEKAFRVRYRIDGVLYEENPPLPLKLKNAVTSRVKIMSQLDISERRLPQDGRIKLKLGKDKEMDFRVSVLPTLFGEKIVLRLLDKSNLQL